MNSHYACLTHQPGQNGSGFMLAVTKKKKKENDGLDLCTSLPNELFKNVLRRVVLKYLTVTC